MSLQYYTFNPVTNEIQLAAIPTVNQAFPVGSIFLSVVATDPAVLLGYGTWQAIGTGRVLVGLDAGNPQFDTLEKTGGALAVTPTGSNSAPALTMNPFTPAGTVAAPVFTGNSVTSSAVSPGTPAGTNSAPTFSGSALAAHAHELPLQIVSNTSHRLLAQATFGSGTSRAAASAAAADSANTTSAAVALSQGVSAGTPAGTVSAPTFTGTVMGTHQHTTTATGSNSAPAFTGTQATPTGTVAAPTFTGQPASVVQPYLVILMWKRTA
jgi:hypothetical protein